jgi:hypothetical protein
MQSRRPARSGCEAGVSRPPVLSCPYGRSCSASGTRIGGIATLRFVGTSYEGQGLANRREVKSSEVLRCRTTTEWFQPKAPLDLAAPRLSRPSGNLGTRPTSRRPNALSWRKEQSASVTAAGRPGFYTHRKRRPLAIEPRGANPRGRVRLPIPEAPRPLRPLLRALDQDHDRVELACTRVGVAAHGMRDSAAAEAALQLAVQLSFNSRSMWVTVAPDTAMASTAIAEGYAGGPWARPPFRRYHAS